MEQLVLSLSCHSRVLELAHTIHLAGHLGRDKTAWRILQRFYWPTLYNDVAKYCRQCPECQKAVKQRVHQAPLIPLPMIEEPFARIAMNIMGPLPHSRAGHCYLLVVCEYATQYPEAIPMKSMWRRSLSTCSPESGFPKEILTDQQGSNFTSHLLREIY